MHIYTGKLFGVCLISSFMHHNSIAFNHDSSFMCVSSDHGTVHVFASEDPARNKQSK